MFSESMCKIINCSLLKSIYVLWKKTAALIYRCVTHVWNLFFFSLYGFSRVGLKPLWFLILRLLVDLVVCLFSYGPTACWEARWPDG